MGSYHSVLSYEVRSIRIVCLDQPQISQSLCQCGDAPLPGKVPDFPGKVPEVPGKVPGFPLPSSQGTACQMQYSGVSFDTN